MLIHHFNYNTCIIGYLNDPEATASTIDVDGWLHTGDIGYVDDDEEVFIVDRVKELIKFKGFQACILMLHFPLQLLSYYFVEEHHMLTPRGSLERWNR